ncbi:hypothetical protein ACLKA7_016964 [Drosophila subpalustris]
MSENSTCNNSNGCESVQVSYALFLHRQELRRPKRCRRLMRVASTKLQLTNELIWLQQRRQWQLEMEVEMEALSYQQQRCALNRERQYRDLLMHNMQQHLLKQQRKQRQHLQATLHNRR